LFSFFYLFFSETFALKRALIFLLPETESNCKQLFAAQAQGNEMKKEYRSAIVHRSAIVRRSSFTNRVIL